MKLNKETILKMLARVSPVTAAAILAIVLLNSLITTRVTAEVGQPVDQVVNDLEEQAPKQVVAEMEGAQDRPTPVVNTPTPRPSRTPTASGSTATLLPSPTVTPRSTGTPMASPTTTPGSTATLLPSPTATIATTQTVIPTVTPTVPVTPGVTSTPGAGLPLCATHNPLQWHALISADGNCHYDHEAGHNPMELCGADFGIPGTWFGSPGQSISYFWQTPDENMHKHEGYKWVVRCGIGANSNPTDPNPNYIRKFRSQVHFDPMPFLMEDGSWMGGYLGNQHSFSLEAEVCTKTGDQCGIIRTGGWANFGDLEIQKGNQVITQCAPLPNLDPKCPHGFGGRKIHNDTPNFPPIIPLGDAIFWYAALNPSNAATIEALLPFTLAWSMSDPITEVTLDTLFTPDMAMYCPDMECWMNGSTISQHEIAFDVRAALFDPDGDGFASGTWYTDQYGVVRTICTAPGVQADGSFCIPLIFDHVPVGSVEFGDPENLGIGAGGTRDFDLSPAVLGTGSEWWITWPLRMMEDMSGMDMHGMEMP